MDIISAMKNESKLPTTSQQLHNYLMKKMKASCPRRKIKKMDSSCTAERQEEISQALVRMISVNMMPISFCNSKGFKEFMNVLEPGYRCPCPQTIIKRLELIYNEKQMKIQQDLSKVSCIAMTNDGWSSRSQDSYISATAHFINVEWVKTIRFARR
jgi:hypothetical protein